MARGNNIGRTIVLLILILLIIAGGLLWFDYLGVVQTRNVFKPIYSLMGLEPRKGISTLPSDPGDLDADRITKRLEALDLRNQELDLKDAELQSYEKNILQMAQEIDDRLSSVEQREKNFAETLRLRDDRETNLSVIADYINGMPPVNAVQNLLAMDDQDMIDVLRKVEENVAAAGTASSVAYWFSLMPPQRAAEIQRKMTNKPSSLP